VNDDTNTKTKTIQQRRFSSLASTSLSHMLEPRKEEAKGQVVDLEAGTEPQLQG
jgi:hypothetical protein